MISLACSCTDHRTAELCGVKAKLSQVCLLLWQSQLVPNLKGSLINLHSNEKDTFYLGKECKFLAFGKGLVFSQQNKQALRMLCKERLCKPSAETSYCKPEIQILWRAQGKLQILCRDTYSWGFPITPRGAGDMNFLPCTAPCSQHCCFAHLLQSFLLSNIPSAEKQTLLHLVLHPTIKVDGLAWKWWIFTPRTLEVLSLLICVIWVP